MLSQCHSFKLILIILLHLTILTHYFTPTLASDDDTTEAETNTPPAAATAARRRSAGIPPTAAHIATNRGRGRGTGVQQTQQAQPFQPYSIPDDMITPKAYTPTNVIQMILNSAQQNPASIPTYLQTLRNMARNQEYVEFYDNIGKAFRKIKKQQKQQKQQKHK